MAGYIDREALEAKLNERLTFLIKENGPHDHYADGYDEAVSTVEDFPAAAVAPVLHGLWAPVNAIDPLSGYRCSNCRRDMPRDRNGEEVPSVYCPSCGAKMGCPEKEDA